MNQLLSASLGYGAPSPSPKPQAPHSDPGTHLSAALAAHRKGNHHGAKKHALKAVNMLHRMALASGTPQAAPPPADPSAPPAVAVAAP